MGAGGPGRGRTPVRPRYPSGGHEANTCSACRGPLSHPGATLAWCVSGRPQGSRGPLTRTPVRGHMELWRTRVRQGGPRCGHDGAVARPGDHRPSARPLGLVPDTSPRAPVPTGPWRPLCTPEPEPRCRPARPTPAACGSRRPGASAAVRRRRVVLGTVAAALLAVLALPWSGAGGHSLATPGSALAGDPVTPHAAYVVQPGDTLWSIAERLDPAGDPRPVVAQPRRRSAATPSSRGARCPSLSVSGTGTTVGPVRCSVVSESRGPGRRLRDWPRTASPSGVAASACRAPADSPPTSVWRRLRCGS